SVDETEKIDLISSRPWCTGDLHGVLITGTLLLSNISSRPGRIVGMEPERGFCTVYFEAYDHTETVELILIFSIRRPPMAQLQNKPMSKARNKAELEKTKRKKQKRNQEKKEKFQQSKHKLKGLQKRNTIDASDIETGRAGAMSNDKQSRPINKYHFKSSHLPKR
ncbi:hypothetical protein MXB_2585, partial [Myxobolus squamalis]